MGRFVHLHLHSEYSMVDGIVRIKPLMATLKEMSQPAVALTDMNNLFAVVKMYNSAVNQGIKPIFGAEISLLPQDKESEPSKLVLLCQNETGYKNLTCLISKAYLNQHPTYGVVVDRDWIAKLSEGLIALSAGIDGDIAKALLLDDQSLANQLVDFWQNLLPGRFYLELTRTSRENEEEYIRKAVVLAEELNVPVVATNNVRFISRDDFYAHEARVCINQGRVLEDDTRPKDYTKEQYLKTEAEMVELFSDIPEALANSVEIAKRCSVMLTLGQNFLPRFPIPDSETEESYLAALSKLGLDKRIKQLYPELNREQLESSRKGYDQRLQVELDVICRMGFPGYFLIVADFIQWAHDNGVPVGPGRGSGAGSLVAYALGITDLDPLKYDLLFERFLNPERVSMPDFDIDFCMEGRDRVIDYVAEKYGRDSVSQIITFGTMAAKAVVRDVGRVLGHPYGFVDRLAKLIPFEIGMTLDKALDQEQDLRNLYDSDSEVFELLNLAKKLEGITRNAGKHAGGVVISPSALIDFTAVYCEQGSKQLVSQFDKDDVEAVGLVKFDFLGLRTLTIIDWAVRAINARGEEKVVISRIKLDCVKTFDLLKSCLTTAVFQLESKGMKDLIFRLQPDCFEDIVALVALFRPGPLQSGMVDDFIDRKHGRANVEYPHPDLEPVLSPTYGVILYQEQVMQIAQVLAGYSLGAADMLRRAMGKKKPEEMAKQRKIFTEGAIKNNVEKETATYIFDLMEKFAGYGFNKSHSAAYALVAYQTAWLKAHFPADFMASVLSSDMDNTDKVVNFIEDCKSLNLEIKPPCVNHSDHHFKALDNSSIRYGLGAIKGVGESAIESIINNRGSEPYQSLFNIAERVAQQKVNRRVLEALIRSGSMDVFSKERSVLLATIDKALKLAEKSQVNLSLGRGDLFSDSSDNETYKLSEPLKPKARLNGEKETLGLYFSGHPVDAYLNEARKYTSARIAELSARGKKVVNIIGLLLGIRKIITKRGKKMLILNIDDNSAKIDVAVFEEIIEDFQDAIVKDEVIIVEGEVSQDKFTGGVKMAAKRIFSVEGARETFNKRLCLDFSEKDADKLSNLKAILESSPGDLPVIIRYKSHEASADIALSNNYAVSPSESLTSSLRSLLGDSALEFK